MLSKPDKYTLKILESVRSFVSNSFDSDKIVPQKYLQKLYQYNLKIPSTSIVIEAYDAALKLPSFSGSTLNNLMTILLLCYDNINTDDKVGKFVSTIYVDILLALIISSCKNDNVDMNSLKMFTDIVNSKFIQHVNVSYDFPIAKKICPINCPILATVKLLNRKTKHHKYVDFLESRLKSDKSNKEINKKMDY